MREEDSLVPIPVDPLTNDAAQLPVALLALSKPTLRTLQFLHIRTLGDVLTFDLSRLTEYGLTRTEVNRVRGELLPFKVDLGLGRVREQAAIAERMAAEGPESAMLADVMPDLSRFRYTRQRTYDWEMVNDHQLPPGNFFLFTHSKDALQFADTLKPIRRHYLPGNESEHAVMATGIKDDCYGVYVSNELMHHVEPLLRVGRSNPPVVAPSR